MFASEKVTLCAALKGDFNYSGRISSNYVGTDADTPVWHGASVSAVMGYDTGFCNALCGKIREIIVRFEELIRCLGGALLFIRMKNPMGCNAPLLV